MNLFNKTTSQYDQVWVGSCIISIQWVWVWVQIVIVLSHVVTSTVFGNICTCLKVIIMKFSFSAKWASHGSLTGYTCIQCEIYHSLILLISVVYTCLLKKKKNSFVYPHWQVSIHCIFVHLFMNRNVLLAHETNVKSFPCCVK